MNNQSTTITRQPQAELISRRAYNMLCFGLVTLSFLIMFGMYSAAVNGTLTFLFNNGTAALVTMIVSFIGSIGGLVAMSVGKSKQSVPISVAGYLVFSFTFGLALALGMMRYTGQTITVALGITACISGIFLIAGTLFPEFFASIGRLLSLTLVAVILIEFVAVVFLHVDQTIFDYVVIAIFCGFIGYDSYQLAIDDPTVPNAIWHASDIYVDIANVLIRVLDLLDNR